MNKPIKNYENLNYSEDEIVIQNASYWMIML